MTKQEFISYFSSPEKLNGNSIIALEKLVQEYPYFQMGRMLYLKSLHNERSIDYEKNLHVTTAYAPSGKVLYNLIKKKTGVPRPNTDIKEGKADALIIPQSSLPIISDHILSSAIFFKKEELIENLHEIPAPIQSAVKDESDAMQLLEKQMLREAYRTSMTIDFLEQSEPGIKSSEADSRKPLTANQSHSFTDWIKIVSNSPIEPSREDYSTSLSLRRRAKTEIVENYILEETSKLSIKPRSEFYSADVMAKKSLVDNETFVSETLAKIYLKQGNLPKALRSYEILLIKYPEKVHIFAPLLEKIKNLLDQQKKKIN